MSDQEISMSPFGVFIGIEIVDFAVRTVRPKGKLSATTDLSIAFIRPPQGDSLEAVAEVIHAGKRLFRTEISVFSADKLVAKANATFMIVEPKQ